jgi:sporulation protein YlmC with PRC-barrel domain
MPEEISPRAEFLRTRDFIGRDVLDAKADKVGTVSELLLGRRRGDVRYIAINLGLFSKTVLIPVEQLDMNDDVLVLRQWVRDQLGPLPTYEVDRPLTPALLDEMERAHPRFYGDPEQIAKMGPADGRIVPLRDARDFKLSKGDPDPRGWNVFGADGERVGTVADLLVDPASLKVRYLDVDLADDLFKLKEDRHVIIPTDAVDLRERGKDVWIKDLNSEDVARFPAYIGGSVDPVVERRVEEAFNPSPRR